MLSAPTIHDGLLIAVEQQVGPVDGNAPGTAPPLPGGSAGPEAAADAGRRSPLGAGILHPRHLPLRPTWLCRACGQNWPCGAAKVEVLTLTEAPLVDVMLELFAFLSQAARDLYLLNAAEAPRPDALFRRFLGWLPQKLAP